jgi:hypothetical protein
MDGTGGRSNLNSNAFRSNLHPLFDAEEAGRENEALENGGIVEEIIEGGNHRIQLKWQMEWSERVADSHGRFGNWKKKGRRKAAHSGQLL